MSSIESKISKYASRYMDSRLVLGMDVVLSVLSSFAVLALASLFSGGAAGLAGDIAVYWMLTSLVSSFLAFWLLRTYTIIIRHTTFKDVVKFLLAAGIKLVMLFAMCAIIFKQVSWTLWLILAMDIFVTLVLILGVRLLMIIAYDMYKSNIREIQKCKRVMVYGMSDKSLATISRLRNSPHYNIVGVLCHDKTIDHSTFSDKKVYVFDTKAEFEHIASKYSLAAMLFATDSDVSNEQDRLVRYCTELGLGVLVVPAIGEFDEDSDAAPHIREVKIEDLLGREEIKISLDDIKANFAGKTVLVTGAAGSIGSELCRQLAGFGVGRLILYDNAETPMHNLRLELEEHFKDLSFVPVIGDVRLERRLDFAFRTYRPQIVFHSAAYKHVPLMEENPCEAVLVNVAGSRNVADKCIEYGIEKMVMVSTDKAVNPTNIMGCTKRLAEIYVQALGLAVEAGAHEGVTKFVTTRFGNVLGSNGSVIPRFRDQIAKGGPVTVTHPDITRFFMTIPEACRLVMEAATMPVANKICVFDMGKSVKIDTLARRMIELSGLIPDVDIKVEYTGLRPGEKLYEEVLSKTENTDPTSHDRIRIARVRSYDYAQASAAADRLEELSRAVEIPTMVRYMKEIVPEFISKNSKYEMYDKK